MKELRSNFFDKDILNEISVYEILKDYGIRVPEYYVAWCRDDNRDVFVNNAMQLPGERVVVKIVSSTNLHKTDIGGVKVVEKNKECLLKAFDEMLGLSPDGIVAVEFLEHLPLIGEEILIGVKRDDAFGYILTVGPGGTYTELLIKSVNKKYLPEFLQIPCNDGEIEEFIDKSWTFAFTLGKVRGVSKKCDFDEIFKTIKCFINIVNDFSKVDGILLEEIEVNPFIVCRSKLYAGDGVLRIKKTNIIARQLPTQKAIRSIIEPKTIAFCGVSEKKQNMGRIILNNTLKAGFPKENMCVIKEGVLEIDGVKAYSSLKDVPYNIDMYVISVPVESVYNVLDETSKSGKVNGVVLITGGVGEKSGTEHIQEGIVGIVKKAKEINPDFALNGGNCMGMVLNRSKVNTFFIPEYKMKHPLGKNPFMVPTAFISQSGAFVISTLTKIPHLICDYTITVGNQQDITVVDYIDYFSKTDLKLILAYIEGFKSNDGKRLVEILKRMRREGKYLVIYKAGRTSIGQKAVMGHTASVAGDYIVFEKLLSQTGAIVCDSFDEFCDMAYLSSYLLNYKLNNNSVFVMSNAGFETTGMADNIFSLKLSYGDDGLKAKVYEVLKKHKLDAIVDYKNPMDLTPMATDYAISDVIRCVYESNLFSTIFVSMVPLTPAMNTVENANSPDRFKDSFINMISDLIEKRDVFIPLCVASGSLYDPYVEYAMNKGFVVFRSADRMIRAFEKFYSIF